ncbi:hypothetical protein AWZ03_011041 [Drosophila navojoa]|uniref:PLAT domain-containing protein n=1 Tax=Drosophila navojoa TaxID=7232 RepID=A0A484B3Z1_DRONA|nr:hypothetical protein AWZ03_011041 [Drosophila navojoa]
MDPLNPRQIDSAQFCNLQAILEKRCLHSKPVLQVQWAVYKYEEHVEVQLSVKEEGGPWCYLNVTARNVVAEISGGHYREISARSQWLTLDGSRSVEPGQNKNDTQELIYTWSIRSDGELEEVYLSKDSPEASVDFRVLMTMHVKPVLRNIYDKSHYVPMGSIKTTLILNNHCPQENTAYIAIYKADPNSLKPANFTVQIRSQQCNAFDLSNDSPTWRKFDCSLKTMAQNHRFSQCHVHYLSIFSATAYKIEPFEIQQIANEIFVPPVSSLAVIFFCAMILGVGALLLLATLRSRYRRKNLIRVMKSKRDEVDPSEENVIVQLRTGGGLLSFTTANVTLEFISDQGRYKVVIYQNPVNPHLALGTSRMIRLSDKKVQLPCRLIISHDLSGRYPSWYCRSIQVDDLRNDLSYTFPLHCWIRRDQKDKYNLQQIQIP